MDTNQFKAWCTAHRLNKTQAADALGLTRPTIDEYLAGKPIKRTVELACAELTRRYAQAATVPDHIETKIKAMPMKGKVV